MTKQTPSLRTGEYIETFCERNVSMAHCLVTVDLLACCCSWVPTLGRAKGLWRVCPVERPSQGDASIESVDEWGENMET